MTKRRRFSREFKLDAVARMAEPEASVADLAIELEVDRCMLYRWQRELTADQAAAFPGQGKLSPEAAKLVKLERELSRARMEVDILKKVLTAFGGRRT